MKKMKSSPLTTVIAKKSNPIERQDRKTAVELTLRIGCDIRDDEKVLIRQADKIYQYIQTGKV